MLIIIVIYVIVIFILIIVEMTFENETRSDQIISL